jgi:hypothetical protein
MPTWKFYRESSGAWEEVGPEKWRWEANYDDGSTLKQYDDAGIFHQFKEIQQENLASFRMVSESAPSITIAWKQGLKLIHFYRNVFFHFGEPDEVRVKLYCFGYQEGSSKTIFVIMPDNSICIVDDVDKIELEG